MMYIHRWIGWVWPQNATLDFHFGNVWQGRGRIAKSGLKRPKVLEVNLISIY